MLYQHFVDCVFHFNSYEKHKGIAHFHSKLYIYGIYRLNINICRIFRIFNAVKCNLTELTTKSTC